MEFHSCPDLQEEVAPVRKKRQYKRRQKQTQQAHHPHAAAAAIATAASFGDVDILHHDMDSSEEDIMSPVSVSVFRQCCNQLLVSGLSPFLILGNSCSHCRPAEVVQLLLAHQAGEHDSCLDWPIRPVSMTVIQTEGNITCPGFSPSLSNNMLVYLASVLLFYSSLWWHCIAGNTPGFFSLAVTIIYEPQKCMERAKL